MSRVTIFPNGVTLSNPRYGPMPGEVAKRGKTQGWTRKTTARFRRWLFSVDGAALPPGGFGLTLTVKDRVPTPGDWKKCRDRFVDRLEYQGLEMFQWLTEFQRRGVPHLHGMAFFAEDAQVTAEAIKKHWLGAAKEFRPGIRSQHISEVYNLAGWLQYQSKHAARGIRHVQRVSVPAEWLDGTGRMWGVSGDWPVREQSYDIDLSTFHRARRGFRSWLVSEARRDGRVLHAARLRGLLKDSDRKRSTVRGVGEFIPEHVTTELLLAARYGEVFE